MENKELMELLEKQFVTLDELNCIECEVEEMEFCGASGSHYGYHWYVAKLEDGTEFDLYLDSDADNL